MLDDEDIRALVQAGASAPTGGNAQPWRVRATNEALEVALDPARSGQFIDVDRTSSMLGLGAFVESVVVAAPGRGLAPNVELLGFTSVDAPVARITFDRGAEPREEDHAAARLLSERATNRRPWNGETIDAERLARVATAAAEDGAHRLVAVSGEARFAVADALAAGDVVRTFNRAYRDEMHAEFRWTREETEVTRDGLDLDTLELSDGDRRGLTMMRRAWFVSLFVTRNRIRAMGRAALLEASHLGAVVMPREATPERLVAAGRAVQRTWLAATRAGLAIQPWCVQPFFQLRAERDPASLAERDRRTITEIDAALRAAWQLGDDERAIFSFRISIPDGPPSAISLRRPWRDFTTIDRA